MSKGTKAFPVRLPNKLLQEVNETIQRRNDHSKEEPWTFSDFVRIALREKISKMERGRKGARKFAPGPDRKSWVDNQQGKLQVPNEVDDFEGGIYEED